MIDVSTLKPGQVLATTNIAGYEGQEVGIFLGFELGKSLLYIQWINGRCEKVFREDVEKTFYKTTLQGIVDEQVTFKRKPIKNAKK